MSSGTRPSSPSVRRICRRTKGRSWRGTGRATMWRSRKTHCTSMVTTIAINPNYSHSICALSSLSSKAASISVNWFDSNTIMFSNFFPLTGSGELRVSDGK